MKLRNIYLICKNNYNSIKKITGNDSVVNGRTGVCIKGWEEIREALDNISKVPSMKEKTDKFWATIPRLSRRPSNPDILDVTPNEWTSINLEKEQLLLTMETIIQLYESMDLGTESEYGIDIKLPKVNDFSEYVQYISDINFVFSKCPFLQDAQEELCFKSQDVGSLWLTFVIFGVSVGGVSIIANNLLAFIDKCIILRSHYLNLQKQKIDLEKEKKDNKYKETILQYINDIYKKEVEKCITDLENTTGYQMENADGDEIGRIKQCLEKMGLLIDKGVQIYSTIDSPKETQALFKPLEMKYLSIEKKLKLIEEKGEDE